MAGLDTNIFEAVSGGPFRIRPRLRASALAGWTFVGRTPASAADPLAVHSDFVETSTSRARAPSAGQGPAAPILFGS